MPNTYGDSPVHTIIEHSHEYDIMRFDYNCSQESKLGTHLDITFQRGDDIRRLRFLNPRQLAIEKGFPQKTGGLLILDIRHRQWGGLGVEVIDFEASHGSVTFLAEEVVDLDNPDLSP